MLKKTCPVILLIVLMTAFMAISVIAETPRVKKPSTEKEYLPKPDEFIPVEKMPEMLYEQAPVYPEAAIKAGIEADVYVQSLVNKNGDVVKAKIAKTTNTDYGFEKAALDAAYKCKFMPAIQDSHPVAVWITYKVSFALDSRETEESTPEK